MRRLRRRIALSIVGGMLLLAAYTLVYGDPEASGTLERANIGDARALLADINDEVNASIILAARRLAPELQVVSVVEDADAETYHRYAGADDVVRPRVVVGERLAAKTRQTELHDAFDDVTWSGEPPALTEVLVESGSELAGQTLAECRFSQRFGLTVLGGWFHGEFVAPVDPDRTITDNAVLLVVGEPSEFRTLGDMSALRSCEHAVVAGYGVVGQRVAERLSESGVEVTVLDSEPKDGVDIVGDITDPETLDALDLAGVDSVVLTLSRDSLAVYAALVVENRAPAVDTLARADDADNVQRYYDAGIEYALSVSEVTAHMLEGCLSEEGSDTDDATGWAVVRVRAPQLAGDRLGDIDVRVRTDVHVVAIEREGQTHSNPGGSFELRDDDVLVLAGDGTAVTEFERAHQSDRSGAG